MCSRDVQFENAARFRPHFRPKLAGVFCVGVAIQLCWGGNTIVLGWQYNCVGVAVQLCWGGSCTATPGIVAKTGVAVQLPPQQ